MAEAISASEPSGATPLENIFGSESKPAAPAASAKPKEEDTKSVPATDKDNTEKLPVDDSEKKKKPSDKEKPKQTKPDESKKDSKESDEEEDGDTEDKTKKKTPEEEEAERKANAETLEKRFKDTQTWGNKLSQENADLKRSHAELEKKLDILTKQIADPDYDPANDPKYKGPSEEDIAKESLVAGKIIASKQVAISQFGEEKVNSLLAAFREVFKDNEAVQLHVRNHDSPVMAAIDVLEDVAFREKYGARPAQQVAAIRKEHEAELRKEIRAEIIAEIKEGKGLKDSTVDGLSSMKKSDKGRSDTKKGHADTPLDKIFTA